MRLPLLLVALGLGLLGACGSFGSNDSPSPPPTTTDDASHDAGTIVDDSAAPVEAGSDVVTPTSCAVQASKCGGHVALVDFSKDMMTADDYTTTTLSKGSDACDVIHTTCGARNASKASYYRHALDVPPAFHLRLRQHIQGPVSKADKGTDPLTFGCGLFFTTDKSELVQVRFEVSDMSYEIDGDNDDTSVGGGDPPGTKFPETKLTPATERTFLLDAKVLASEVVVSAMIDTEEQTVDSIRFAGHVNTAELRCGMLQVDQAQKEDCDLTIRQVELEICDD